MTWFEVGKAAVQLLVGAGVAAFVALFLVSAQKRKLLSESGKTDAEADTVLADAYSRRASTQINLIGPYEKAQEWMQRRIDDLEENERRLRRYIDQLPAALRAAGIAVPEMPAPVEPSAPPTPPTNRRRRR